MLVIRKGGNYKTEVWGKIRKARKIETTTGDAPLYNVTSYGTMREGDFLRHFVKLERVL